MFTVTVAPTELFVSVVEVRRRLRLEDYEDEEDIKRLIRTAGEIIERVARRAFLTQTIRYVAPGFIQRELDPPRARGYTKQNRVDDLFLPMPVVASVASVQYLDTANVLQTLAGTEYELDNMSLENAIRPAFQKTWPDTLAHPQAVRVTYITGGAASTIPSPVTMAALLLIGHLHLHREATAMLTVNELPFGVQTLLAPYVIPKA